VDKVGWWKPPLLLDGAMGSLLFGMGLQRGQAPESWLFEHPKRVEQAHRMYVEAGSDIIQSNTFGATPSKLAAAGMPGQAALVNRTAIEIARSAATAATIVAGNIGPSGLLFPPMGSATEENLLAEFRTQAEALASAGADFINIETMYDVREALCAVRAAQATGLPVFASMTFDKMKRGYFTMVGDRIGDSLAALHDVGADVVGFNCSVTPIIMLSMLEEARAACGCPLIAQPNAGDPRPTPTGVEYDALPGPFVIDLVALLDAGASVIGGCCGTTPEFIREARKLMDAKL